MLCGTGVVPILVLILLFPDVFMGHNGMGYDGMLNQKNIMKHVSNLDIKTFF